MSSRLIQAVPTGQEASFIADNIVYKDKILSGIQVKALEHPATFVSEWETYIKQAVGDLYGNSPNLRNDFYAYIDYLGVPNAAKKVMFAKFVEKFIEEFNKHVVGEDVMGLAVRKLERKH